MKIKSIRPYRLRGHEHFLFMTDIKNIIIEESGTYPITEEGSVGNFIAAYNDEMKYYEMLGLNSTLVTNAEDSDIDRDSYYRSIVLIVKAYEKHSDAKIQGYAAKLLEVIDKYGDLRYIPYDDETICIQNFCREIRCYKEELQQLHLNEWIDILEKENIRFQYLMDDMKRELLDLNARKGLKNMREKLDNAYKEIVGRIEALSIVGSYNKYQELITKINKVINHYFNKEEKEEPCLNNQIIPESFY